MIRRAPRATWSVSEPGLHTASLGGQVLGYVVVISGGFIAFDAGSTPLGRFASLRAAKKALA